MTLPSTGPLSLANVNTELGRASTTAISLGESAVRSLAGVASGTIAMSNLRGKSSVVVNLPDVSITATRVGTGVTATATFTLLSGGTMLRVVNGTATDIGSWVTPNSAASDYEVYATLTGGTLTSGVTGSWQALTSSRSWSLSRSSLGESLAAVSLQIRKVGTTNILDTGVLNLHVIREA